jgi:predicted SprT family Zn-dependent metalloprotease
MAAISRLIDTYPAFVAAVQEQKPVSIEQWLSCWAEHYMAHWPVLHQMVVKDYGDQGEDWRQVARQMIFPGMNDKLPAIEGAYKNLKSIVAPVENKVRRVFDFQETVYYVLYIGLGNGAGWATKYEGNWAVLFGLEGIVDSGFDQPDGLEGLVAHELGHVIHHVRRAARGLGSGEGPWWQLYEEGFAQRCETSVAAGDRWHMRASDTDDDWLAWCQANRAWLAAEFLRVADHGESVRPFFGSWYELRGHKQTGYFLGHQVISNLAINMTLSDIALLDGATLERKIKDVLLEFAADAAERP